MTTQNLKIDAEKVEEILQKSNWGYEYSGYTPNAGKMQEYINEIESNISLKVVELILKSEEKYVFESYEDNQSDMDINQIAAYHIADYVANQLTDCIYEGVTFKIF